MNDIEHLSSQDHLILSRIAATHIDLQKKSRAICRAIGLDWLEFRRDKKKRGDPRIRLGATQYNLDPDSLQRHARLAEMWDELPASDAWAVETKFTNPYEFEPQASINLVTTFRASFKKKAPLIRLDQTDKENKPRIDIYTGAAQVILPTLDLLADCSISSPPYWRMRDWGPGAVGMEQTIEEYIENVVAIYREVRRVMRPDGVVWVVIGDRYAAPARPEASTHGRFIYHPQPGAPADTIPWGNLCLIPQRLTIALQEDGWIVRSCISWDKIRQVQTGVTKRPLTVHDELLMLTTRASEYYFQDPDGHERKQRAGPFARLLGHRSVKTVDGRTHSTDILRIAPDRHDGHTAPFPLELVKWCAIRTCPVGGTILEPFAGSGTVGVAALEMGLNAILIEINPKFVALMRRRINNADRGETKMAAD